jgi:hypothetical protein
LSGKGELLTEAIEARIRDDVEALPAGLREQTLPAIDAYQFAHTRERAELRALLLEGATAARTDEDVRERLHETLMARIDLATDAHEEWGDRAGVDGSLDMRSLVLLLWSADVGLGLLDALGIEGPDEKTWSTLVLRLLKSLEEPNADPGAPSPRALPGD